MVCVMLMVVGMTEFFNVRRGSLRPGVRLLQTNLSVLGHEQQLRAASKMRRQIKTGVAHGTIGMGIGGSMPVPPPPPPTWTRGGHSWIYDEQYGNGVRPNDSVWCDCDSLAECKEKCGKAEEPEPEPEPETVPGQESDAEETMVENESEEEVTGDENESAVPEEQPNEEPTQEEDEPVAQQEEPASKQDEPEKPSGGTGYILTVCANVEHAGQCSLTKCCSGGEAAKHKSKLPRATQNQPRRYLVVYLVVSLALTAVSLTSFPSLHPHTHTHIYRHRTRVMRQSCRPAAAGYRTQELVLSRMLLGLMALHQQELHLWWAAVH